MYFTGYTYTIEERLHQIPNSGQDLTSFRTETSNTKFSGINTIEFNRWEKEYFKKSNQINRTGESVITPLVMSGLVGWFDAADSGTLFNNTGATATAPVGSGVSYWADKSPKKWNAVQVSGANRPNRSGAVFGGRDSVYFDGVNNFLSLTGAALNIIQNSSQTYIFTVAKDDNYLGGSSQHIVVSFSHITGSGIRASVFTKNGTSATAGGRRLDSYGLVESSLSQNSNLALYEGHFNWGRGTIQLFTNAQSGNLGTSGAGAVSDTASANASIGNFDNTGHFPGYISELVIISGYQTDFELSKLRKYLATKWQIGLQYRNY